MIDDFAIPESEYYTQVESDIADMRAAPSIESCVSMLLTSLRVLRSISEIKQVSMSDIRADMVVDFFRGFSK
jgi:hypothetical protein